ncbi:MAG: hypothetical protein HYS04_08915 [Acidobacteria bacterium]|nr:hypothetical protein [Acidobacteriota bacterium]
MTCEEVKRCDLAELYARGELTSQDASAFEEHYWQCASCLEELDAIQTARSVLTRRASGRGNATPWKWAAAALLVASLGAGALWTVRKGGEPKLAHTPVPNPQTAANRYAALAEFELPPYQPLRMRSSSARDAALKSAMVPYLDGRPIDSIAGLRAVVAQHPDFAPPRFYLAACLLQAGDIAGARQQFTRLAAQEDSVYLEESLYLLAQADLLAGDAAAAQRSLERVVGLGGARRAKALQRLEKLAVNR